MTVPVQVVSGAPMQFMPVAVALPGTCIAFAAGLWLQRQSEAQTSADFERGVARIIEARMRQPIIDLRGAGGLFGFGGALRRMQQAQGHGLPWICDPLGCQVGRLSSQVLAG